MFVQGGMSRSYTRRQCSVSYLGESCSLDELCGTLLFDSVLSRRSTNHFIILGDVWIFISTLNSSVGQFGQQQR